MPLTALSSQITPLAPWQVPMNATNGNSFIEDFSEFIENYSFNMSSLITGIWGSMRYCYSHLAVPTTRVKFYFIIHLPWSRLEKKKISNTAIYRMNCKSKCNHNKCDTRTSWFTKVSNNAGLRRVLAYFLCQTRRRKTCDPGRWQGPWPTIATMIFCGTTSLGYQDTQLRISGSIFRSARITNIIDDAEQ